MDFRCPDPARNEIIFRDSENPFGTCPCLEIIAGKCLNPTKAFRCGGTAVKVIGLRGSISHNERIAAIDTVQRSPFPCLYAH